MLPSLLLLMALLLVLYRFCKRNLTAVLVRGRSLRMAVSSRGVTVRERGGGAVHSIVL